jgi:hypothetical protein
MAEAIYYILNIEWALKFNHNKDSKYASPITDGRLCKLREVLIRWDMKLIVGSAYETLHC